MKNDRNVMKKNFRKLNLTGHYMKKKSALYVRAKHTPPPKKKKGSNAANLTKTCLYQLFPI